MSDTTQSTPAESGEVRSLAAETWAAFTDDVHDRYDALGLARDDLSMLATRLLASDETRLAKVHAAAYMTLTDRFSRVNAARLARLTR